MPIVKVKEAGTREPVYVNTEYIVVMRERSDGTVLLRMAHGEAVVIDRRSAAAVVTASQAGPPSAGWRRKPPARPD